MILTCPQCLAAVRPDGDAVKCTACGAVFPAGDIPTTFDAAPPADPWIGRSIGGCTVLERIGQGGMGVVYKAEQKSLGRIVAIKVLPEALRDDPQVRERFQREISILAKLNHPNIVNILDGGISDDGAFFVMEYVDGVSLRRIMQAGEAGVAGFTNLEALRIIPQICEALEYAHCLGIIHRDIKPENIFIDRSGRVRLLDFGLSRIARQDGPDLLTRATQVLGTFEYMAPEQREASRTVDHRADLYSLGVVIYEMLTGELPIGRFDPPSHKNLQIDVRLDEVVLRTLDKSPDRRYQRASELKTEVERISTSAAPEEPPIVVQSAATPSRQAAVSNPTPSQGAQQLNSKISAAANTVADNVTKAATMAASTLISAARSGKPESTDPIQPAVLPAAAQPDHRISKTEWIITTIAAVVLESGFFENFEFESVVAALAACASILYAYRFLHSQSAANLRIVYYGIVISAIAAGVVSLSYNWNILTISSRPPFLFLAPWLVSGVFSILLARLAGMLQSEFDNRARWLFWLAFAAVTLAAGASASWVLGVILFFLILIFQRRIAPAIFGRSGGNEGAISGNLSSDTNAISRPDPLAMWALAFSITGLGAGFVCVFFMRNW